MTNTLTLPRTAADRVEPTHDLAVFIGRFSPFHEGHLQVIREGLRRAHAVCVLVGSPNRARSYRYPFTFEERLGMIWASLAPEGRHRVYVVALDDVVYNEDRWIENVQRAVETAQERLAGRRHLPHELLSKMTAGKPLKIALIGHSKDHTSYYLKRFPQWDSIEVPNHRNLSSTPMRHVYFSNAGQLWLSDIDGHKPGDLDRDRKVPSAVRDFLIEFMKRPEYQEIRAEYEFIRTYQAQYAGSPFPPTHVTVDAVVVVAGNVLLVKRKERPGKGLSALPGGFIQQDERLFDACLRELYEETNLDAPEKVLRGSLVASEVFDDVHRSSRGRTITHAYLFHLDPVSKSGGKPSLPRVRGGDDAAKARWVPLADIDPTRMYEDHAFIIQKMLGRL